MAPLQDPTGHVLGVARVDFADPKGFYYPGEKIAGKLFIRFDKVVQCKKFAFIFKGESTARWETAGSGNERVTHRNNEIYFHRAEILFEPAPPDETIIINPGEILHPFEFQLPNNLPPSSIFHNGSVMYTAEIILVSNKGRLESATNTQAWIHFEIKAPPLNLDNIRHLLQPITDAKEKYLCCLCCRSGPIRVSVMLQKQVYHPGEQIVFSVEIDNRETNKRLGKIHAVLMAWCTIIKKSGKKGISCPEEVSFVQLTEGMQGGSQEKWQDRTLNVPEDTTTSFDNCNCMHLNYKFTVYVQISSAFDTQVSLPVIISNWPQTTQPVGQSLGTWEEMPAHLGSAASHSLRTGHLPHFGHPQSTSYPLKTITQQPAGTIPDQPPPPYPMEENTL